MNRNAPRSWIFWLSLIGLLLLVPLPLSAQGSRFATDTVKLPGPDTVQLSHSWLVPQSATLTNAAGQTLSDNLYAFDHLRGQLIWESRPPVGTYLLRYRYFIAPGERRIRIRALPTDTLQPESDRIYYQETLDNSNNIFWETDQIRKSGSISRGITVGNNRSLTLNSGLRLQIEGDLGDGLNIVGAISDENIPIQPDGTTQQLSDFDRIFLRINKGPYTATIGDYEVEQKGSRFGNFYRNVQGLQLSWEQGRTKATVSSAVAKGKFHTNSLMGIDGVSGPYRLTGRNGERFFIVLAGSERVYLNGQLMTRGENQDYIINYNTAEITFTAKHVITNITRIVVDFEYNDQYYNRSLVMANLDHQLVKDRVRVRVSYARDADNPNAPFSNDRAYELARDTLAQVGDADGQVTTAGVFPVGWDPDGIRYAQTDTLIGDSVYTFYRYSRDSTEAIYSLFFSFVGEGNGNYEPDRSGINANVFTWIAPGPNGQPQGSYAPLRSWVLPRLLQVTNTRVDWNISKHLRLQSEVGLSLEDQNRLSSLDDADNAGLAMRNSLLWENVALGDTATLDVSFSQQYVGTRYQNLDRVYQAEYNRIWDLDPNEVRRDEHIVESQGQLSWPGVGRLRYEAGLRQTGPQRTADRQVIELQSLNRGFLQGNYRLTRIARNDSSLRQSLWWRQEGDIFWPIGAWAPGVVLWMEDRQISRLGSGEGSFAFTDLKPYLRRSGETLDLELSLNVRRDREFYLGHMREKSLAYTWYAKGQWRPSPALRLAQTTAYRTLAVQDTLFFRQGLEDSRTLNTNWQLTLAPAKRWVYANAVYEVTAEQLAQQEIRYLQVNPGQGQYVWLDSLFNNDGIQDVGEFQLATNPLVADFIRVVLPSRTLAPTTRASFTGSLRWDFRQVIAPDQQWWKELSRQIRLSSSVRLSQNQQRRQDFSTYFIRVNQWGKDSSLLNANATVRQDVTLFQNSPKGDLRFSWLDNQSLLFLTTGQEQRRLGYWSAVQRWNLNESRSIENEIRHGERLLVADNFPDRNFRIPYWEWKPQINFQWNRQLRISGYYQWKSSQNLASSGEADALVRQHRLGIDTRINLGQRNNLFIKTELVRLTQTGTPPMAAAFEMKEGLEPGINGLWQVFLTWYVLQNVEASVTYDGRATAGQRVLHTGRVQLRAFF